MVHGIEMKCIDFHMASCSSYKIAFIMGELASLALMFFLMQDSSLYTGLIYFVCSVKKNLDHCIHTQMCVIHGFMCFVRKEEATF